MSKRKMDDELNTVKSEGGSQITESPTKKRAYVRRKSGEKEAIKRWEDAEITALWRSIYKIVKQNVPELVATPELKANGRTPSKLHNKLESMFKDLVK